MVFRGGNNGGFRGKGSAGQGAGFRGKGGGSRGGFSGGRNFSVGPPDRVIPLGYFDYACQMELICKVQLQEVPYFNAPIFLENKEQIGKIDEIFGSLRDYSVSIKLDDNMKASSFKPKQTFFIEPHKLLPINRFLPKPPQPKGLMKKGPTGGVANSRGGTGRGRAGGRGGFIRRGGGRGFGARSGGSNRGFGGQGGGRARW